VLDEREERTDWWSKGLLRISRGRTGDILGPSKESVESVVRVFESSFHQLRGEKQSVFSDVFAAHEQLIDGNLRHQTAVVVVYGYP
jgi:hypothetical protein